VGKALSLLSIRTALLAGATAVFVPFVLAMGVVIWNQVSESERQIHSALLAEASGLARVIDGYAATARDALSGLSQTRYIEDADFASLHQAASRIESEQEACLNIVLFRSDGQQMLNTLRKFGDPLPNTFKDSVPPGVANGFSHLPRTGTSWVREAFETGRPVLSDVYYGPVVGGPIASLAVPVRRDGQVVYVWIYGFNLKVLQKHFGTQLQDSDKVGVVADRRGIIVMRDPRRRDLIGEPASPTLRAVVAGETSAASNRAVTLEGMEVYRAFAKTADGWTVFVGRPRKLVNELLHQAPLLWAMLSASSLLLGGMLLIWLTRLVASPLQRLANAAPAVQEGRTPPIETRILEIAVLRDALAQAAEARGVAVRLSLLEGLVRHAPVGIALFDSNLRFVMLNERAAAVDGVPLDAHIGKTVPEVIGSFGNAIEAHLRQVRETRQVISVSEIGGQTPALPGNVRWWIAHYFPLLDSEGRVKHIGAAAVEITDLKEAERKLHEADRRKDVYLATLAHELRNPLAPIRNAVAILRRKGPAEPELVWARDVIDRQATQMARLLEELLDVSRIGQGKLDLRKSIFDLRESVRDALEMAKPAVVQNEQMLAVDVSDTPVWIEGDRVRLAQVFVNLLSNATKYTERSGRIEVKLTLDRHDALASVVDNGVGIPESMLEQIFEPFAQSQSTRDRAAGGLGIGLALVKGIVELHGGSIQARSAGAGKGSTFELRLPLSGAPGGSSESSLQRDHEVPGGMRIVVADDNRDNADTLADLLRAAACEVTTAYDGVTALRLIREQVPNVVVMDIGMPGMDGYEVAQAVRGLAPKPYLIALTGWGQESDRAKAFQAGFDRHFTKPIKPEELVQLLAELASAKQNADGGTPSLA
jgi:PAS domain S-box-containing protein